MKKFGKILICALSALFAIPAAGCNFGGGKTSDDIDLDKTQVYVFNIGNAIGNVWLDNLVARFTEEYKDKEFPNGTKGIQVLVDSEREYDMAGFQRQHYSVIFNSGLEPLNYTSEQFQDITDMVTEWKLPGEDKTIADKLTDKEKEVLTYGGGYIMLPHAQWFTSPTYNRHLFDSKGLYFADDPADLATSLVLAKTDCKYGLILKEMSKNIKKSCGPDLLYGTEDDGLPASVEEYKQLTDCMVEMGITPFVCYASTYHYSNYLLQSMWATLEGANGVNLWLSNDGETYGTTQIVKVENGAIVKDQNGIPVTETLTLDGTNNWKMSYQASKYYALDFFEHIFNEDNISTYYDKNGLSTTTAHTSVQNRFLESEVNSSVKPVAFLIDGSYWENESKEAGNFAHLEQISKDYYENSLDYRIFHLPTQAYGKGVAVGEVVNGETTYFEGKSAADVKRQVGISTGGEYVFLNKAALNGDASSIEAAKLFVQYLYTDENLNAFVKDTGMLKEGVNFTLTEATYNSLTEFTKNSYDLQTKSMNMIIPFSTKNEYPLNSQMYDLTTNGSDDLFVSLINGKTGVRWPINGFRQGYSLDAYFVGLGQHRNAEWWNGLLRK